MDSVENGEKSKSEPPPLRIDPKCVEEALKAFFQPIKNGDPRLDFYTLYKKESSEYDNDYIMKYDEDLNTTLIFAGLFSAVSSAFVLDVYPKLQPDSSDQSAALLRAILLTLNQSGTPDESFAVLPVQEGPPGEIVTATALLYASLAISLLAAFIAMLGKQWLNRYLRHTGGSMIERCGDRQRKCDGIEKWPFNLFVESLPVMLQTSLLLLACGLCQYMISINAVVAYTLISLTGLGLLFYIGIVIAGASSYDCPFQTPVSVPLRILWKKIGPSLISATLFTIIALGALGEAVYRRISHIVIHLPHFDILRHLRSLSEGMQLGILRAGFRLPSTGLNIRLRSRHPTLPIIQEEPPLPISQEVIPWFAPGELANIQTKNTSDVRCVSWVFRNITDPEALDTAIQRAGTIRWFDDGVDVEPPYDLVISTFHACFGSDREVYPGSRDRAYYSGRAILWIHALASCKSRIIPLPTTEYKTKGFADHDLEQLLEVIQMAPGRDRFGMLLSPFAEPSPSHSQWSSDVLLHQTWAQITLDEFWVHLQRRFIHGIKLPLDALFNRLLTFCNLLGFPVEEEVLKVQDKSDRLEQVLDHVNRTITSALNIPRPQHGLIMDLLLYLTKLKNRPWSLAKMAYGWCAVIWESCQGCEDLETLLFHSLEVGFRHLHPVETSLTFDLTHTEHHRELADVVFKSRRSEAIADLLCALITYKHNPPVVVSFGVCKRYIVDLHNNVEVPFSPRLQDAIMCSIELIGYKGFEEVGTEKLVGLLNHLPVGFEKGQTSVHYDWSSILMEAAQSSEGLRYLTVHSWEVLMKLASVYSWSRTKYAPHVTSYLLGSQEWDKLECWVHIVWLAWPPDSNNIPEDLRQAMESLFHHRPNALQELTRSVEESSKERDVDVPKFFKQMYKQAPELSSPLPDHGGQESSCPSLSGSDKLWELLPLI